MDRNPLPPPPSPSPHQIFWGGGTSLLECWKPECGRRKVFKLRHPKPFSKRLYRLFGIIHPCLDYNSVVTRYAASKVRGPLPNKPLILCPPPYAYFFPLLDIRPEKKGPVLPRKARQYVRHEPCLAEITLKILALFSFFFFSHPTPFSNEDIKRTPPEGRVPPFLFFFPQFFYDKIGFFFPKLLLFSSETNYPSLSPKCGAYPALSFISSMACTSLPRPPFSLHSQAL